MRSAIRCYLYISLLLFSLPVPAASEVAGIKLADTYMIDQQPLVLNGAGVRSKFFIKVYVGALYLGNKTRTATEAAQQAGPKSMQMIMLYKEVAAEKITSGWEEGFRNNLGKSEYEQLAGRLEKFNALFPALHKGDHVNMDYIPGDGTTLTINGTVLGKIDGDEFFAALIKVWLGKNPADSDLKEALLGN